VSGHKPAIGFSSLMAAAEELVPLVEEDTAEAERLSRQTDRVVIEASDLVDAYKNALARISSLARRRPRGGNPDHLTSYQTATAELNGPAPEQEEQIFVEMTEAAIQGKPFVLSKIIEGAEAP
jgi:hypothetical protein